MTVESRAEQARSLYIHIPFCDTRCPYCDFAIQIGSQHLHQPYAAALTKELEWLAGSGRPSRGLETVYLGGGTPGVLAPSLLGQILEAVEREFGIAPGAEITIEANPTGLTQAVARSWVALGINRVSLGVQSLDDQALRWLGRNHNSRTAESAIESVAKAGVPNISCDLIYAVPSQPTSVFESGLKRLLSHTPQHVSCYELTVEAGTPLARSVAQGEVSAPSERDFLEQHRLARDLLETSGLFQYEVSNYSRPGRESLHNLGYWLGRHYLAVGCGAHGFVGREVAELLGLTVSQESIGARYWNLRSAPTYVKQVARLGYGRRGYELIDRTQLELERIAGGLRMHRGVELRLPGQLDEAMRLADLGLLTISGQRVAVTPQGMEVLDRLTLELVAAPPERRAG